MMKNKGWRVCIQKASTGTVRLRRMGQGQGPSNAILDWARQPNEVETEGEERSKSTSSCSSPMGHPPSRGDMGPNLESSIHLPHSHPITVGPVQGS